MKKLVCSLAVLFVMSIGFISSFGQENNREQPDTTYKIYTHTIVGSNNGGSKITLPNDLFKAFDEIKNNFNYSNYKLLSTQFQLIKNDGSISYKSILKTSDFTNKIESPIFAEWGYQKLSEQTTNGVKQIGFRSFRFNMKYPMKNMVAGKNNELAATVMYENVGISSLNIDFPIGKPVVFASIPIEISDKTLFFVVHLEELK